MPDSSQFNIDRAHRGRWTITFNNPPVNMCRNGRRIRVLATAACRLFAEGDS
jgi:hypothetical protein